MLDRLRDQVKALPGVRDWTSLEDLLDRLAVPAVPIWDYPMLTCEAAGGEPVQALPAAASLVCLCASINVVDDILDDDAGGPYEEHGAGRAANLALALQAAATQLIADAELTEAQRLASLRWVAFAGLGTARGQELDVAEEGPENDANGSAGATGVGDNREQTYWRIVESKSTPLLSAATALGAVAADCSESQVDQIARVGALLGKIIQISDDLTDAMAQPAEADWQRPHTNLSLLYALTADHDQRDRFRSLLSRVDDHEALVDAQLILTTCGAIGFCVYNIVQLYREAQTLTRDLGLQTPGALSDLLARHIRPTEALLEEAGLDSPAELWAS